MRLAAQRTTEATPAPRHDEAIRLLREAAEALRRAREAVEAVAAARAGPARPRDVCAADHRQTWRARQADAAAYARLLIWWEEDMRGALPLDG